VSTTPCGTFTTSSWDEKRPEQSGPSVSHARVTNAYEGLIEGSSAAHYVLYYSGEGPGWGSGHYHGYEQVTGTVDGRRGSFVLEHTGSFDGTTVRTSWTVVAGSGTDELRGLRGQGGFEASEGTSAMPYTFDYTLEPDPSRASDAATA
jgi:hypothetical protein